ncbi:N-acetyltransferase [Streptomyces sp. NPDC002055]|uniref:GNAT family N-acetyltransferase n=1 Tax=Streptomyces sp. NPDC002055 TaxID=3154534 RepID=UPI00332D60B7
MFTTLAPVNSPSNTDPHPANHRGLPGRLQPLGLLANWQLSRQHILPRPILDRVGGSSAVRSARLGTGEAIVVRSFAEGDSVARLTRLLHRAYSGHAAEGRVFFASYQSVEDTAYRLGRGECWLALRAGELVGTVTVAAPHGAPEGYPAPPGSGSFWQLAVDPSCQGTGLGQRLLALAEERISELGSSQVVVDTSVEAVELVGWYRRRGYVPVGSWRWSVTNYESVVLLKELMPRGNGL